MSEIPSRPQSTAPQVRQDERWVLQVWILAIGITLLWALFR